jgi:hypothetical protein
MPHIEEFHSGRQLVPPDGQFSPTTSPISRICQRIGIRFTLTRSSPAIATLAASLRNGPLILIVAHRLIARAGLVEEQAVGYLGLKWCLCAGRYHPRTGNGS